MFQRQSQERIPTCNQPSSFHIIKLPCNTNAVVTAECGKIMGTMYGAETPCSESLRVRDHGYAWLCVAAVRLNALKLVKETDVVFKEESDVVDLVSQHGDAFDSHTEGKA